jgi:hypothetical protein
MRMFVNENADDVLEYTHRGKNLEMWKHLSIREDGIHYIDKSGLHDP